MASSIHRMPIGFMHIGGAPTLFSSPGTQTHWLLPLTRTVMEPPLPSSETVASLVTCSGPDRRARVILGSSALSITSSPFLSALGPLGNWPSPPAGCAVRPSLALGAAARRTEL